MPCELLIIEDHPAIRTIYREIFRREKELSIVGEAATGKEAKSLLAQSLPDVIILDLILPDVDGVDLLKQIRAEFPEIAVVVVSGEDEQIYKPLVLAAGAADYINKLDVPDALVKVLHHMQTEKHR